MDNHINLDFHLDSCLDEKIPTYGNFTSRDFCEMNKETKVIFIDNDFYLLSYNNCICRFDKYDFIENIINKLSDNVEVKNVIEIKRSVNIDNDFKEYRLRGLQFQTHLEDVNYIYSSASKTFAITTTKKYIDYVFNRFELEENKEKCINYIKNSNLQNKKYLINEVNNLYSKNFIIQPSKINSVKTIDKLITKIKQQCH